MGVDSRDASLDEDRRIDDAAVATEDSEIHRLGMGSFVAMQCMGLDSSECETVIGDLALTSPEYHKIDDSSCYVVGWSGPNLRYMQMIGYKDSMLYWTQPIMIGHFSQGIDLLRQALKDHERKTSGVTESPRRRGYESQPVRNLAARPSRGPSRDADSRTTAHRPAPSPADLQAPQSDTAGFTYSTDPRPMAQIFGPGVADLVEGVEKRIAGLFSPGKKNQ